MIKKVLVTGGAGYIGSVLVPQLVKQGYEVVVIDSLYFGKSHLGETLSHITLVKRDIRTVSASQLQDIDAVIHLAALSNDPMANFAPDLNYEINTEATMRLARLAKACGVQRFIFASSCSIYHTGWHNHQLHTEKDMVSPQQYYSHSKYLAEQMILSLATDTFAVTILRKGTVAGYSPRLRFDLVVNTMVKSAITTGKIIIFDGSQHRPLVDVRDVAAVYTKLLKTPLKYINKHIFNVVYKNYALSKLAVEIQMVTQRFLKKPILIERKRRVRDRTYRVSGSKLTRIVGITPRFSAGDSAIQLLRFLRKQRDFDYQQVHLYNIERMKQLFPNLL